MLDKSSPITRFGRVSRFLLPLSILLNLFFIALVVGHVLQAGGQARANPNPLARALAHIEASLSAKDAATFRSAIEKDAPAYRGAAERLDTARAELEAQVVSDHFDRAQVQAAFAHWHAAWDGFFNAFSGPLTDALAQISPDGRRRLVAERKSERMGRFAH